MATIFRQIGFSRCDGVAPNWKGPSARIPAGTSAGVIERCCGERCRSHGRIEANSRGRSVSATQQRGSRGDVPSVVGGLARPPHREPLVDVAAPWPTKSPILPMQLRSVLEGAQPGGNHAAYKAVDLGGRESQVCVRTLEGNIVHEGKVATHNLGRFLKRQSQSRVILETCAEAFSVADAVLALGHEVRVIPATLVRSLGVGARSMKSDVRDARVLSEVSCRIDLPSVHLPTELARQRRSMCGMREELVASRTALVNCVRGWARAQVLRIRTGQPETFPQRMRAAALAQPDGLPEYVERVLVVI